MKRLAPSPEAALATDHLISDIGQRSRRGGTILLVSQGVRVAAQLLTMVVLVRLLSPSTFGLLAMVGSLGVMLDLVKEFGLSAATIQRQDISHAQVSALFWINAGVGVLLAAGLFAGAPALAAFYAQPDLEAVARCLALGFLMSGLTVQHWALLRRQMRFAAIAGLETAADLAAFAVAIGLALEGAGYWALVAQRLVMPGFLLVGSWAICRWRPARPAGAPDLPALLRYGGSITASGLMAALARSVDQVLIGWLWGPAILGLYERTTRLVLLPVNNINAPVYAAGMPALSRLIDQPERYRSMFRQIMQKLALLTMPVFALAAMLADWVVYILFGPAWLEAAPLVALFSVTAAYLPVLLTAGLLFMTQGRTGEMVRATLIDGTLTIGAIVAGLPWGVVGVAASIAAVGVVIRLPLGFWLATRRGPVSLGNVLGAIAPAISAGAAGAAAAFLLHRFAVPTSQPTPAAIVTVGMTAGGVMLLVALAWSDVRRDIAQIARFVSTRFIARSAPL
ncbi:MAG: lipopolysaccharide biosynthesis protein [Alphaproteobacteria bacterium]|nr:lipopolysaccharide biosynthesis protein [Alphaproteobacteria bacterium]